MQLRLCNGKIAAGLTNSAERFRSDLIYLLPTCFTSCKRRDISRTSIKPGLCGSKQRCVFCERNGSKQTERTEESRTNIIMRLQIELDMEFEFERRLSNIHLRHSPNEYKDMCPIGFTEFFWTFSIVLYSKKHDVSETGFVSVLR
jgi:hypothetical protein